MMLLSDILLNLNPQQVVGNAHIEIAAIAMDSKSMDRGALFVAMKGTKVDSHAFIDEAIDEGLCEGVTDFHKLIQCGQYMALNHEAREIVEELFNEYNGKLFNVEQAA